MLSTNNGGSNNSSNNSKSTSDAGQSCHSFYFSSSSSAMTAAIDGSQLAAFQYGQQPSCQSRQSNSFFHSLKNDAPH
ncbi:hypothetical protein T4E_8385 [Trichinella pseudospiralis]|uniref:Uncharacterized protein n=1 Tax=Trichinella pseudospiralis TaxID=6337 RepID=A0A0V0XG99_TRIPS|nr:hypothetical protein T4E_9848 [Trichinella pseudospiralis]KRX86869.1 hypothetical protein T4E_8385 [Trichinella pseudospiralis]